MQWHVLGIVPPGSLAAVRVQAHAAALLLGAVARATHRGTRDGQEAWLEFDPSDRSIRTPRLSSERELRLHYSTRPQTLSIREDGGTLAKYALAGSEVRDVRDWIRERLSVCLDATLAISSLAPTAVAARPIQDDEVFVEPHDRHVCEFEQWLENGATLLEHLRRIRPGMTRIRLRPRGFEVGAIITFDRDRGRAANVGLSLGDRRHAEPYFYCTPIRELARATRLPTLPHGTWISDGSNTAVLTARELLAAESTAAIAHDFLNGAIHACHSLRLHRDPPDECR